MNIFIHPQRDQSILSILRLNCKQTYVSTDKREFLSFDIDFEGEK